MRTVVFSPHLCVGFLFSVVHSRPLLLLRPRLLPTPTQLSHTTLSHTAWQAWHSRHCAGSCSALGRPWSAVTPRHFWWQVSSPDNVYYHQSSVMNTRYLCPHGGDLLDKTVRSVSRSVSRPGISLPTTHVIITLNLSYLCVQDGCFDASSRTSVADHRFP